MTANSIAPSPPRRINAIGVWVLRILLALVFGAFGIMKLAGAAMLVAEFDKIGLGQWFRYVTGITEVVGALLVIRPATTFYGALLLICVCIGAFFAQLGPLHGDVIHVLVLAALLALLVWLTKPKSKAV
jgi:putative oxidoreductase